MFWVVQDCFGEETQELVKYLDDYKIVKDAPHNLEKYPYFHPSRVDQKRKPHGLS